MTLSTWLAFFAASWIISLSPGAGALSCMSIGMRYGYRQGVWNILGLQLGVFFLVAVVAAGVGAVLAASAAAFLAIKWFGVAYLIYLGVRQWRAAPVPVEVSEVELAQLSPRRLVLQGFLINASNPKGIIFMLAVLPQFININTPQLPQYGLCALSLFMTDAVVMSCYTLLAARVLRTLRAPHHIRWMNRTFGTLFVGAGLLLASFRRSA